MQIYLAARYGRREEMLHYAEDLQRLGHRVTSRWIQGEHEIIDPEIHEDHRLEQSRQFAQEDLEDIARADTVIAFSESVTNPPPGSSRGGRHVEFGVALATGKRIWIVGPRENAFHGLAHMHFDTWRECRQALEGPIESPQQQGDMSLRELVETAWGTSDANGWHDTGDEILSAETAHAQLAGLAPFVGCLGSVIEKLRKDTIYQDEGHADTLIQLAIWLKRGKMRRLAERNPEITDPAPIKMRGSATEITSRLMLIVSEIDEAMSALWTANAFGFREEVADIFLRLGDLIGGINRDTAWLGPIDLAAEIRQKNDRNRTRGYRHGGKLV